MEADQSKLISSNGPFIPLGVVEEILLRLDIQTLFQCSLVCNDWNGLITSPDFIRRSSARSFGSRKQILLIKVCQCKESLESYGRQYIYFPRCRVTYSLHWDNEQFDLVHTIESPAIDDFKGTKVIGVSNGLICLANNLFSKFILWNPTVRRYAWLPITTTWDERLCSVGFGFDNKNNDFKVVSIVYRYSDEFKSAIEYDSSWVFSYITWSWKRLTCSILHECFIRRGFPQVSFNGVLHWIVWNRQERYKFILTFDLTHGVFGQIFLPSGASHGLNSIVTTGDSLLLIQEMQDDVLADHYFFSVWIMKHYGNHDSWVNVSSSTIKIDSDHILGATKNGDIIIEMEGGQICRYNPTTLTGDIVKALENNVFFGYYTESLFLLEKRDVNSY